MNTTTAAQQPTIRREPRWDELDMVPGYPMRDGLIRYTHLEVATLMRFRAAWWVDLAQSYMSLVENGCMDAIHDVRDALAQAEAWQPRSKADLDEVAA